MWRSVSVEEWARVVEAALGGDGDWAGVQTQTLEDGRVRVVLLGEERETGEVVEVAALVVGRGAVGHELPAAGEEG